MGLTYFKRFRMELALDGWQPRAPRLRQGYRLLPWDPRLIGAHAETKYLSFRSEIDANVFPCFAEYDGCLRLMNEIVSKEGFLPAATWLAVQDVAPRSQGHSDCGYESCGTIQGICDRAGLGAVQNLGILPDHRDRGLGTCLLLAALDGFRRAGLRRAYLEVTAQNEGAVRLYKRLGFVTVRTIYKAVETPVLAGR